jgi:ssDNA-binding Zn-finger/Zn-ribbon topoisomerase 1
MTILVCPECGAPMILRKTHKFKWRNGQPRLFWGCSRFPECRATHGAHPDGSPLGHPADSETKAMRMATHRAAELAFGRWDTKDGRDGFYDWLKAHPELKQHVGDSTKLDALEIINAMVRDRLIPSERADAIVDATLTEQAMKRAEL